MLSHKELLMPELESTIDLVIPDVVECLESDSQGLPIRIINPVFEIYFEPQYSQICDFDRIVMDANGIWHWEHEEYYPEYAVGQMWSLNYPENLSWHNNRPPDWFSGEIDLDDPEYGKHVNSLSWYVQYNSLQDLLNDNEGSYPAIISSGATMLNGRRQEHVDLQFYTNRDTLKFAPAGSQPAKVLVKAPKGYVHWLTLGVSEDRPEVLVFYPKKTKKNIRIRLHHDNKVYYFPWHHGVAGLFIEIKRFIDDNFNNEQLRTKTFFEMAFNKAEKVESAFNLVKKPTEYV